MMFPPYMLYIDPAALVAAGAGLPGDMAYLASHCHLAAVRAMARARTTAYPPTPPAPAATARSGAYNSGSGSGSGSDSGGQGAGDVWRPLVPFLAKDLAPPEARLLLCLATVIAPTTTISSTTTDNSSRNGNAAGGNPTTSAIPNPNSALKAAHFAHKTHFDLPLAYALCSAAFGGDVLRWHTAFAALRDKGRPSSPPV